MSANLPTCNTTFGNKSYYVSASDAASNVFSLGYTFVMIWFWGILSFIFFLISVFMLSYDTRFKTFPIVIYLITIIFITRLISNYLSYNRAKNTLANIGQPCVKSS